MYKYLITILISAVVLFITQPASAANDDFSLSVWVKPTTSVATKAILAKAEEFRLATDATGHPVCQIMSASSWQTAVVSSQAISVDSWSHIACSYDLVNLKIFVNGVEAGSQALTASIDDTANALQIGKDSSSGSTYGIYTGLMDGFQFFNYAFNEDDIKTVYNSGVSAVMGSSGTNSATGEASNASGGEYCVPGDTSTCDAPVLHLKMDEKVSGDAKTLYDISGNGNNGTTVDGANNTGMDCAVQGKIGSGCEFDGADDYADAGSDVSLDDLGSLTLSYWIKSDTITSMDNIMGKGSGLDVGVWNIYVDGAAENGITFRHDTSDPDVSQHYHNGIFAGVWQYHAWIWNGGDNSGGGDVEFYLDGVKQAAVASTGGGGSRSDAALNFKIGASNNGFDGKIDDVRIYNYARTPAQIAWDYNKGKPVAEWRMDECQGTDIHDESGNGLHGTLNLGGGGITSAGTCADGQSTSAWYNGATGRQNASMSFDGTDDYVNLADPVVTDKFTVSAWIKSEIADPQWKHAVSYHPGFAITGDQNNDEIHFLMNTGTETSVTFDNIENIGTEWHHYIATYDGAEIKTYLDGKYKNSTAKTGNILTTGDFNIGSYWDGHTSTYTWNGQIDEVKIFNYALTEEQVKQEYNRGAVRFGE